MFNRKKAAEPKKKHDLSQFGMFEVPDFDKMDDDIDSGDEDFEAELAAITAGNAKARPKPAKLPVAPSDLDRMVAASLRDIGSDEELSGDEDDPDLLDELSGIVGDDEPPPSEAPAVAPMAVDPAPVHAAPEAIVPTSTMNTIELLQSRIEMYRLAEKIAKEAGDSSKARSRGRGLKSLESMLRQAKAGKPINVEDIPPEVSTNVAKPAAQAPNENDDQPQMQPVRTAPSVPEPEQVATPSDPAPEPAAPQPATEADSAEPAAQPSADETKINALLERQREYKVAALTAKKAGDTATALQYIKIVKVFDTVLASARKGEPIDLSDMPPHPTDLSADLLKSVGQADGPAAAPQKQENETQQSTEHKEPAAPVPRPADEPPPQAAGSILEALTQRLQKYQSVEANAKADGNERKVRQTGRIVKQYQDAIRMHKAGKPVAFDELPSPPGFPPIPSGTPSPAAHKPADHPVASRPPPPIPAAAAAAGDEPEESSAPKPPPRRQSGPTGATVMNKTVELLVQRHREFKEAAIEAKQAGDVELAKEYLRTFKGIENLLNVAKGGLPVDLSTLPISPKQREKLDQHEFEVIDDKEESNISDDLKDVYHRLEKQLQNQLEKCKNMSAHHKALGDVAETNRFDNLALDVQRDLDMVSLAHRRGGKIPKFRFEQKSFNIVKCNTDLAETDFEVQIVRGISYNVTKPREVDTFVKLEVPNPQQADLPYRNKTAIIYNTDNPEYNEKFVTQIQPKSSKCQRLLKRSIKLEVFEKGGLFRSDTRIGVATVKLQPLETACEIHDSFDIMDGRKATGGKLEVKVRVRNPLVVKQVVSETEKWLILN